MTEQGTALPQGKYIDFSARKKYRIAKQYIDKNNYPKKNVFVLLRVVLSYAVTSGEFACRIQIKAKLIALSNPGHSGQVFFMQR